MDERFSGRAFVRGADGYEQARRAAVWNARTPERYPDAVAQAGSEEDVAKGVRLARERGWKVGVRSGGHSWAGNHVREGGLLLDVSALDSVEIDAEAMTATVGPGTLGNELLAALAEHDLFFPAGHCPGVGLGGYLLQGGFGWNGRVHGPACMSVEAIEAVTADGETIPTQMSRPTPICSGRRVAPDRASLPPSLAFTCAYTRPRSTSPTESSSTRSTCSRRCSPGRGRSAPRSRGRWS